MANTDRDSPLSLSLLLHCRTVVEKQNFVSTGILTHVEGELIEIELPEFELFELGETVKLTIYSPAGRQSIQSIVFAKYEGAIALLQPPEFQKRFTEKREHPRVPVSGSANILGVLDDAGNETLLEQPLEIAINDISLAGVSFMGPDSPYLSRNTRVTAHMQLGFGFNCELQIVRRDLQEDQVLCGAKMNVLDPEMIRPLRALILRQQVEKHAQQRQNPAQTKRSF
ncbi:hypothetical protein SD71_05340 [Cohnella kolymensis]|uniref:PilZ domain-containing protein n=1 Tax=Cohnella kolymensis TaxID=1590652 RepID=A0ABR5A7P9_9BACL|nr:PilZ domain-containing protein [Cohnella kolymensis]KIL36833.1 hypothetical protein SD71_05340 [Cohnella kolymensis]